MDLPHPPTLGALCLLLLHSSTLHSPSPPSPPSPKLPPLNSLIPSFLLHHHLTLLNSTSLNATLPISCSNLFLSRPTFVHGLFTELDWPHLARALASNKRCLSFSAALASVLDLLPPMNKATIFAPREGFDSYTAGGKAELVRAVRRHVAIGRFGFMDFAGERVGEEIGTVGGDWVIKITNGGSLAVEVNKVEIKGISGEEVVVHGVSMVFDGGGESKTMM